MIFLLLLQNLKPIFRRLHENLKLNTYCDMTKTKNWRFQYKTSIKKLVNFFKCDMTKTKIDDFNINHLISQFHSAWHDKDKNLRIHYKSYN